MSEDFGNKIKAIRQADREKVQAEQQFIAEWAKITNDIFLPVLAIAKENFDWNGKRLDFKAGNGGGEIKVTIFNGIQEIAKLYYSPDPEGKAIYVSSQFGSGRSDPEEFPLNHLSVDLIESQIENFLKKALRLSGI